LFSVNRCG